MLTRRSVSAMLGGLPLARAFNPSPRSDVPPVLGHAMGSPMKEAGLATAQPLRQARMSEWDAVRQLLKDPKWLRRLTEQTYADQRIIYQLDPDIATPRSWSPMAKVTFQRQRNVERLIASQMRPPPWEVSRKFQEALHKLMWWDL